MKLKVRLWQAAVVLLFATTAMAEPEPKTILFEDSGPFKHVDGTGSHRNSHNLLLNQRNQVNIATAAAPESVDVGDVAVIVDNGAIIVQPAPASPFDLAPPVAISFTAGVNQFDVGFSGVALDPGIGANLGLGDDASTSIAFPAGFPFLGNTYNTVFINSDGNITFGSGDSASSARDAARHIGGQPRLSPFFADLDPSSGGSVNADVRTDRVVVTWTNVPQFGVADSNTFQAVLHDNGDVDFVYGAIAAQFAVVGIAEGNNEGPINEIDLSADLPGTFGAGAIFEEFNPAIVGQQVDIVSLANEFYATHEDKYDFLVLFTDFVPNLGGAFAFLQPVKNDTLGLGGALGFGGIQDNSALFGSGGELEAFVMMNRIGLYWPDAGKMVDPPIKKFRFAGGATLDGPPGSTQTSRRSRWFGTLQGDFGFFGSFTLGMNSAMSLMAQEAGHRWLAFPIFVHPTKGISFAESTDLLGRQAAHWSFFFNTEVPPSQFGGAPRSSGVEGNVIRDLGAAVSAGFPVPCDEGAGESFFLTDPNELTDGYTELDQYLMGVRTKAETSPFWYVDEPRSVFSGNSFDTGNPTTGLSAVSAQDDIVFCGKRVTLTVDDIELVGNLLGFPPNGPRIPALGDEIDEDADGNPVPDVKTMAFILLVENEAGIRESTIMQVQTFAETWEEYANGIATGGRGHFDSSLDPAVY